MFFTWSFFLSGDLTDLSGSGSHYILLYLLLICRVVSGKCRVTFFDVKTLHVITYKNFVGLSGNFTVYKKTEK